MLLTLQAEKMADTTLIAAGHIAWDGKNKKIVADHGTVTIVGGTGMMAGAQGSITLAGGKALKDSVSFDITLPKHRHTVEAEDKEEEH